MSLAAYGYNGTSVVAMVDNIIKNYEPWASLPEGKRQELVVVGMMALFGTIQQRAYDGKSSWLRGFGAFSRGSIAGRNYKAKRPDGASGIGWGWPFRGYENPWPMVRLARRHYVRFDPAEKLWELLRGEELKMVIDPDQRDVIT